MNPSQFSSDAFIRAKRDGNVHSPEALDEWVKRVAEGAVPDYQVAAWLMAAFLRGLNAEERHKLTEAMWRSGKSLPRVPRGAFRIDKHSTGGVGDKTSLLLVPWVLAACRALEPKSAVVMPMISGRGLGLTGGTLDKLEAIPGFRCSLSDAEMEKLLGDVGAFVVGSSPQVAPADRVLYALRDVTATVDSRPLIVASILSKKLSASLDALVLDVKAGRGGFMVREADAHLLAKDLVATARRHGLRCRALVTDMNEVLGRSAGNLVEVIECDRFLRGEPPDAGLYEVTEALAKAMCSVALPKQSSEAIAGALTATLENGSAFAVWEQWIAAQGGDLAAARANFRALTEGPDWLPLRAPRDGVFATPADRIGRLVVRTGAGRERKEDRVAAQAGVYFLRTPGEAVSAGTPMGFLAVATTIPGDERARLCEELAAAVVDDYGEPGTASRLLASYDEHSDT